jgi:UDP-N-acetylglucosamine 2-epimerase
MDRIFFEELELSKPDYHLGVGSGSHAKQTGKMLERIEPILQREDPKVILVYGDTNSTLAGALAAAKLKIPVAHVEAGLRSYQQGMAEEMNRVLTDHLSTLLFCPTPQSVKNLSKEGIKDSRTQVVKNVGDVMYDSILYYSKIAEMRSKILHQLSLVGPPYYLMTLHRAENTDDPQKLRSIFEALNEIGEKTHIVFPVHPRTRKMMKVYRLLSTFKNIRFIDPVSYLDMLQLEKNAKAILTDSGGVQKEAYWFKVPCFTLREETEWVETVEEGWNVLVGMKAKRISKGIRNFKEKRKFSLKGVFGDGKAGEKIVRNLMKYFR